MTYRQRVAGLVIAVAAIGAALGHERPASSSPAAAPRADVGRRELDPTLQSALRRATADAADDGVELVVESGRRSRAHQELLLREAIAKYGSEAEAARWVATPDTSPHVSGDAIDIGPAAAVEWLSEHGAEYGLCQIYANEPWHYELRDGCPPLYADPTQDPRMQQ